MKDSVKKELTDLIVRLTQLGIPIVGIVGNTQNNFVIKNIEVSSLPECGLRNVAELIQMKGDLVTFISSKKNWVELVFNDVLISAVPQDVLSKKIRQSAEFVRTNESVVKTTQ